MSGGDRLFKPSERGRRDPVSDAQENGPIVNPPRYAKIGGFKSASKGVAKNDMSIRKPGGTK
jgi:hypothetical protein